MHPCAHAPLWMSLLVFLAFALRLYQLGRPSLWYDEAVSVYLAGLDLGGLTAHTARDIHPPFYYYLLHFWMKAAGKSEFAVSLLSVLWGILLLPLAFIVARRLAGFRAGLLAAFLLAISPFNLWYSQEIRMYTLGAFLALLSLYCLLRILEGGADQGKALFWIGYVTSATLGLYSLYYFAFAIFFENLFVLLWWLRGPRARAFPFILKWAGAQLAVAALYLPWLPVALHQATQPPVPPWREFTGLWDVLVQSWTALCLGQSAELSQAWPYLLVFALVFGLGLMASGSGSFFTSKRSLLLGSTLVPVLTIYLASLATPLFHVRYVFVFSMGFYILLALGLGKLWQASSTAFLLSLAVLSLPAAQSAQRYFFDQEYATDDHRTAVRYLSERMVPGDAVLINAGYVYPVILYYFRDDIAWRGRLVDYPSAGTPAGPGAVFLQTGTLGGSPQLGWGSPASDFYATTIQESEAALRYMAQRHERLWVYRCYDTVTDPQGDLRRWLEGNFTLIEDQGFPGPSFIRVQAYRTRQEPLISPPPLFTSKEANLGNLVSLVGLELAGGPTPVDAPIYLTLYWRAQAQLAREYRAFVALADDQGTVWAQWDNVPDGTLYPPVRWRPGEVVPDYRRLSIPPGTPPGHYHLKAGWYPAPDGPRLEALDQQGRAQGTELELGTVELRSAASPPRPGEIATSHRSGANLGDRFTLLDYDLGKRRYQPGETVSLTVFWQARQEGAADYTAFVQVLDSSGKPWAASDVPPTRGDYPTSKWEKGEVVKGQYSLVIAGDAPEGQYRLVAGLYDDKGQRLPVMRPVGSGGDMVDLGKIVVAGREHSYELRKMPFPLDARLGDEVALQGFSLDKTSARPGDTLNLRLQWQARGATKQPHKVTVQLLDKDNHIWGQRDSVPGDGAWPTTGWVRGEVLLDDYQVAVKDQTPPGEYRLVVAMYDAASGQRLPVTVEGEPGRALDTMILLATVTVEGK